MRIRSRVHLTMVTALLLPCHVTEAEGPRALVIEARNLAYDANFRNDQAGLRAAIATLQPLAKASEERAYANYYLSWSYWALAASQVVADDASGALDSGRLAVEHARAALADRERDSEFYTALANAMIVVAILDPPQFKAIATDLAGVRRRALELGPDNPRAVMMDAGMIFNVPPERGGSRERGLTRWDQALSLFESEANGKAADPIAPRWGYALAYGWMANLYLRMTPPQKENARRAAETALRMRPDFWYVREQVLPKLRD